MANGRKMDQVLIKYTKILCILQDPPKFTQIGIFWFENEPSGNPVLCKKPARFLFALENAAAFHNGLVKFPKLFLLFFAENCVREKGFGSIRTSLKSEGLVLSKRRAWQLTDLKRA
jgi:hypothetical protein